MNSQWVMRAISCASVVLPDARRPPQDHRGQLVALDLLAQRLARAEDVLLPDEVLQALRAHALGQRAAARPRGSGGRAAWCRTGSRLRAPSAGALRRAGCRRPPRRSAIPPRRWGCETSGRRARAAPSLTPWPSLPMISAQRRGQVGLAERARAPRRRAPARPRTAPPVLLAARRAPAPASTPCRKGTRNSEPAEARSVLGLYGLTVPFRNSTPVAPKASAARTMAPALPGILHAVQHHHQRRCRGRVVRASTPAAAPAPSRPGWFRWRRCSGTARPAAPTTRIAGSRAHVRFDRRTRRFGGQHRCHFAVAAQRLFEQVEASRPRTQPSVGERAARDRPAHVLQQRVCGAGNRFGASAILQ